MDTKIRTFNSVFIVYFFSLLNFILSIFLQVFLASLFGVKMQMDAYLVAMNIPMIISTLILSFEAVLVPTLKNLSFQVDKKELIDLISTIFNLFALILIVISVLSILSSLKIVSILAPGFSVQQKELTAALFKIMIPSIIFSGLAAFLTNVYHFQEKFALAAFSPVANVAVIIITTFFLNSSLGIRSVAWGVLFASIVQLLILSPGLLSKKQYSFVLNIKQKELAKISMKILSLGVGSIFVGLILIFEKFLASKLPEGSISTLGYAGRMISIVGLFPSIALPTVLLPQLSTYYALKDINKLRDLLSKGIRMTFLCVFPITVLLVIFRSPLIKLLFERGVFDEAAVNNTSIALVCYLGVLIAVGVTKVITAGFLAIHDILVPILLMVGGFLLYFCIAPFLSSLFSFKGLAFAFSFVCTVSMIVEIYILRIRLHGIDGRSLLSAFLKIVFSSLLMGVVALFIFKKLPELFFLGQNFTLALRMAIATLIGFLAFNITCFMLKVNELKLTYELVQERLKMFAQKNR